MTKPMAKKPLPTFKAWSVLRKEGQWTKITLELQGKRVISVEESSINLQDIIMSQIADEAIAQANGE